MNNQPTREQIDLATQEYLERGGRIQKIKTPEEIVLLATGYNTKIRGIDAYENIRDLNF